MRRVLLILLFLGALTTTVKSQVDSAWVRTYNYDLGDQMINIKVDDNGNVYGAGQRNYPYIYISAFKYNSSGHLLWQTSIQFLSVVYSMDLSSNGNMFVTGENHMTGGILLVKFSSNGDTLWSRSYGGSYNNTGRGLFVNVDSEGNVIVTGYTRDNAYDNILTTLKYDTNGNLLWVKKVNTSGNMPLSQKIDSSQNIVICGYEEAPFFEYLLIKYSPQGNIVFLNIDTLFAINKFKDLEVDQLGNIYVVGFHKPDLKYIQKVYKYDGSGNLLWTRNFGENISNGIIGTKIMLADENSIYVTGIENEFKEDLNYIWINKYNSNGDSLWTRKSFISFETGFGDFEGNYLEVKNGELYLSAFGRKSPEDDYEIVSASYDANGNFKWITSYNSNTQFTDDVMSITSDNYNNFYICGFANFPLPNGSDMLIVKYVDLSIGIIQHYSGIPDNYSLEQNYPNPFNPTTKIKFSIPSKGVVSLKIYDISGKVIQTVVNEDLPAGIFEADFDGSYLASGVYFYQLISNDFTEVKKMMLVK